MNLGLVAEVDPPSVPSMGFSHDALEALRYSSLQSHVTSNNFEDHPCDIIYVYVYIHISIYLSNDWESNSIYIYMYPAITCNTL